MTDDPRPTKYNSITVAEEYTDDSTGQIRFPELLDRIRHDGAEATERFRIKTTRGDIIVTAENGDVVLSEGKNDG